MAVQVSKEMTIGEILAINPMVAPILMENWYALSRMPICTGRISGRSSNGTRY